MLELSWIEVLLLMLFLLLLFFLLLLLLLVLFLHTGYVFFADKFSAEKDSYCVLVHDDDNE